MLSSCGDNLPPLTLDEYPAAYREAQCRYAVRCGTLPTVEGCMQMFPAWLHPDTIAAVDAKLVVFHPDVAHACVSWIDEAGCDPTTAEYREPGCFGVFTGTLEDGEACAFGTECISQECWTEGLQCEEACCRGYCTGNTPPVLGLIGDRCRYSDCIEGYCEASTCVALIPDGEPCTGTYQCEVGLSCSGGACKRLPGAGEPCLTQCREYGQVCSQQTRRCEPARLLNELCWDNSHCSPYYTCSMSGRCILDLATEGEYCFDGECAAPYVCDWGTFKCVTPKPDGEACRLSEECASHSCSYRLGVCISETCI